MPAIVPCSGGRQPRRDRRAALSAAPGRRHLLPV